MAKIIKWVVFAVLALLVVLAAVVFALHRWVATDDFRQRVEREASAALGVPVTLSSVAVAVWPLPAVALSGLAVQTRPALTVERIEVRPEWQPLLRGKLQISTLLVRRAVLAQQAIDAVMVSAQKSKAPAAADKGAKGAKPEPAGTDAGMAPPEWLPRRTVLDDVTWISAAGARTTIAAEAQLGDDGLPDAATVKLLKGNLQGLQASIKREASPAGAGPGGDWSVNVDIGGGKVTGQLGMHRAVAGTPARGGEDITVQGRFETRGVEVAAITAPEKALSGKLEASTTLNGRAPTTAGLADVLQSSTTFTVRKAVLHGIDLAKAVKTVGMSRGGETPLETLTGQVTTRGRAAQLSNLVASSGMLSATGNVALSPTKALSGNVNVSLAGDSGIGKVVGGTIGVPLALGGTLSSPEVTLARGGLLDAAAGAATSGKLGEKLRGLFGK